MIRAVFTVASVAAIALGVSVAVAQQDVIKERKALMKANGAEAKIGADMIKGDKPFDMAAAHKMFATFEDAAQKMPGLFPADSQSEAGSPSADDFSPTAKVWENMADLRARFAETRRRCQGGRRFGERCRDAEGGYGQSRQERLRRLSPDLSRAEEELNRIYGNSERRGVRKGAPLSHSGLRSGMIQVLRFPAAA